MYICVSIHVYLTYMGIFRCLHLITNKVWLLIVKSYNYVRNVILVMQVDTFAIDGMWHEKVHLSPHIRVYICLCVEILENLEKG